MTDNSNQQTVLGTALHPCSHDPQTGYLRDGYCHEHPQDRGCHELCAVVAEEFLQYSKAQGNDLITPRPEFDFPGLDPGDHWCLCVGRWVEAERAGVAPPVVMEATNKSALSQVDAETVQEYAHEE